MGVFIVIDGLKGRDYIVGISSEEILCQIDNVFFIVLLIYKGFVFIQYDYFSLKGQQVNVFYEKGIIVVFFICKNDEGKIVCFCIGLCMGGKVQYIGFFCYCL